ncbi:MAG: FHA domain-containing protein [Clostridia bacterium]|nr:FHA domain-containing protein [Clostridia bacterium]
MVKRILSALTACIVTICLCVPAAAEGWDQIDIEQCDIVLPQVDVYFYPLDAQDQIAADFQPAPSQLAGVLGDRPLAAQSVAPYTGGTTFYFLLDISGSIPGAVFSAIQTGLCDWIDRMNGQDKLVLLTFGDEVKQVLSGGEASQDAKDAIMALRAKDSHTNFFNAMDAALRLAQNDAATRHTAVVLTDGKDVSDGGSATRGELLSALTSAELPLYALGIGANKAYLDALGELARAADGRYYAIDANTGADVMAALNDRLGGCWLASFQADSNIADGAQQQLILKLQDGSGLSASRTVQVKDWTPDTEPPRISGMEIVGERSMRISFSEAVSGADLAQNFSIWTFAEKTGDDGNVYTEAAAPFTITDIVYDGNLHTTTLTFMEPLYGGDYAASITNIADISAERNPLAQTQLDMPGLDGPARPAEPDKLPFWLLLSIIAAALFALALLIFLVIRKKRRAQGGGAVTPAGKESGGKIIIEDTSCIRISLHIMDRNGVSRDLCISVGASYVVGRSKEACDLVILDKYLSRRHFELFCQDGHLFIRDLGSRSSTIVNGIPIQSPRPLSSGDTITAGETKFVLRMT